MTVIVNEVNSAPVLSGYANRTIDETTPMTATGSATDSDTPAQTLTYSLDVPIPPGVTINPNSGAVSWTPTEAQGPSTNSITVRVTDNGQPAMSDTTTMTVIVNEVNSAPVLTGYTNRTVSEGVLMTATGGATDSDAPAQTLTFSLLSPFPSGVTINPNNGTVSWTPTEAQGPSTNSIIVRVTDNGQPALSDTNTMTVIVNEANNAPVISGYTNRTVLEGVLMTATGSATDSDAPAQTLTFSLDAPFRWSDDQSERRAVSWTPTEAQGPSTNSITCARDGQWPAGHERHDDDDRDRERSEHGACAGAIANVTNGVGSTIALRPRRPMPMSRRKR
jgi:hypothetical protein